VRKDSDRRGSGNLRRVGSRDFVDFVDEESEGSDLVAGDIGNADAEEKSMGAAFARLIKGALDCILRQTENP
jgi:hypothetical protein